MNANILGICGKANSGKDTAARHLVADHNFKHLSLAQPIKDIVKQVFGFSEEQLWGSSSKREQIITVDWKRAQRLLEDKGDAWLKMFHASDKFQELDIAFFFLKNNYTNTLSARVAAQYIGTDFGRAVIGEDVWVNHLIQQTNHYLHTGFAGVVVSDVRFLNEVYAIRGSGGKIIKLLRNSDALGTGIPNHVSEKEQDNIPTDLFSFILKNQSSIQDLRDSIDTFMSCNCCVGE